MMSSSLLFKTLYNFISTFTPNSPSKITLSISRSPKFYSISNLFRQLLRRRLPVSKSMENLKKNRSEMRDDDRISGKKLRSRMEGSNGGATAEDAELEEFLAILTRLKAGLNRFKAKGAGKSAVVTPPVMDSGFRDPGFELDDFNQCEDDGQKTSFRDTSPEDRAVIGFDLNADPVSDQKSD